MGAVGAKGAKTFVLYGVVPRQVPWVPRMCASIFEFVCVVFCVCVEGVVGRIMTNQYNPYKHGTQ